jgi:general stress protein YciG
MAHENLNVQERGQGGQKESPVDTAQPREAKKSNRGFASMDPAKQREIASKGGRAAHEKGTAHQFSANEAREAGKKGGGTVSQDRHHMAEIGRIGGQARGRKQRAIAEQNLQSSETSKESKEGKEEEGEPQRASGEYHH